MTVTADPELGQQPGEAMVPRWHAVIAGVLAALAALAAAEVLAAFLGISSLVTSIGTVVIDLAPPALKDFAVETLGTADKPVLIGGVLVVLAVVAAITGVLAVRRFWLGAAGVMLLGLVGLAATLADETVTGLAAPLPALAAIVTGIMCLRFLVNSLTTAATDTGRGRRDFLRAAAAVGASAVLGGGIARWLMSRTTAEAAPSTVRLATADRSLPPLPTEADLRIEGLSSFVTPNDSFYRIDTALRVPAINVDDWHLTITGMVDNPMELTYDQLLDYEVVEADITLACVSNEIGGDLVGNARWRGVRLSDLLSDAGVRRGADQLVGRAVDGFTTGSPLATVLDGRDSLIAVGMNGEPLPAKHGFPARIVVPGLYGYVSATKWLAELEVTTFDAFDAYWIPRGWAQKAPIKTQSRIDVPRTSTNVPAGPLTIAGVAWAQHRGIAKVEVQIDDSPWEQARLSEAVSDDSWRQWVYEWQATEGEHRIQVRATDKTGETQTDERSIPRPDGATGWHRITIGVTG